MKYQGLIRVFLCAPAVFGVLARDDKDDAKKNKKDDGELSRDDMDYKDIVKIMKDKECFNPHLIEEGQEFYGCVPKMRLKKDNTLCEPNKNWDCQGFCEAYTYWDYGKEVPFDTSFCDKGPCTLNRGQHGAIIPADWTVSVSSRFVHSHTYFNYKDPNMTVTSRLQDKPKERLDDCGYFAFIPYRVHSCAITSTGKKWRAWILRWCTDIRQDSECATTIWQTQYEEPGGEIVFVATECDDPMKRLPFCKQNPIYLKEGVSLDPKVHDAYRRALQDGDPKKEVVPEHLEACRQGKWPL